MNTARRQNTIVFTGILALVLNACGPKAHKPAAAASPFAPSTVNSTPPPGPAPEGMVWIPGGEFSMGSTVESEAMCGLPWDEAVAKGWTVVSMKGDWKVIFPTEKK